MRRAPVERKRGGGCVVAGVEKLERRVLLASGELIRNGGFEGPGVGSDWVSSGDFQADSRFTNFKSGLGYAYLATSAGSAANNLAGAIDQSVNIPASATPGALVLSFWTRITTSEPAGNGARDLLRVQVQNASGAVLHTAATLSNLNASSSYVRHSFTLPDSLIGQSVRIAFVGSTDGANTTTFRVDDVGLASKPPELGKRVVGYLPQYRFASAWSRIDLKHLTHINYFSIQPTSTGGLSTGGTNDSNLATVVSAAHARGIGVSITVGPASTNFITIAADPAKRATFATNIKNYITARNLDGVDIDWEPPAGAADQVNYALLLQEMYNQLSPLGLKITAAVNPWAQEIPVAATHVMDWINVMCYDFSYNNHSTYAAAVDGMQQWTDHGVQKHKLVMGVPFYGRYGTSWSATFSKVYGEDQSDATRRILQNYQSIFGVPLPPHVDSYTDQNGNTTYFNGVTTMQMKMAWVRDNGYGGAMIWELGQDHWDGLNTYDEYSLLPVIGSMMRPPAWLSPAAGSRHDLVEQLFVASFGTLTLNADVVTLNPNLDVRINNGATVVLGATNHIRSATINAGGALEVKNHKLIVDYTGASPIGAWNGSNYTGLLGQIKSGLIKTTLTGTDIVVGVAEASSIMSFAGASQTKTWQGTTIDGSSVLIRRTYNGDTNLDGRIDGDDFFMIDSHYGAAPSQARWNFGDFDMNGRIDSDDYFVINSVYARQHAPLPAAAVAGLSAGAEWPASVFAEDEIDADEAEERLLETL